METVGANGEETTCQVKQEEHPDSDKPKAVKKAKAAKEAKAEEAKEAKEAKEVDVKPVKPVKSVKSVKPKEESKEPTDEQKKAGEAAKLEAQKLLDAPKIPEGKIEQKWAKKGQRRQRRGCLIQNEQY
eukprot:Skav234126  [mRNA]  locus=scaffold753:137043:139016:- [translate_table: standard]